MKNKYFISNKSNFKFIFVLAILGFLLGICLFSSQSIEVKNAVSNKISEAIINLSNTKQNNILFHLALLSIITLLSIIIIGVPIMSFYYFYEFASIGYLLSAFYALKKIKGLLFGSIFIIINKLLFLFILCYLLINSINYIKKLVKSLKNNKNDIIIHQLYKSFFVIVVVLFIDIFLYFFGNKILCIFTFLLK